MAFDAKGGQCYVAVPVSMAEVAHREMMEQHYQQQLRTIGMSGLPPSSSAVMPIQVSGVKTGGISTGFPSQRSGSVSSPSLNPSPRDMKADPHGRMYPRYC